MVVQRAFVVGNNAYRCSGCFGSLTRACSDAKGMADMLSSHGFDVTLLHDAPREEITREFQRFVQSLPLATDGHHPAECDVVLYFSGHGLESQGHAYVVPIDGSSDGEFHV
jgi:uncharacterized caspase-like protein